MWPQRREGGRDWPVLRAPVGGQGDVGGCAQLLSEALQGARLPVSERETPGGWGAPSRDLSAAGRVSEPPGRAEPAGGGGGSPDSSCGVSGLLADVHHSPPLEALIWGEGRGVMPGPEAGSLCCRCPGSQCAGSFRSGQKEVPGGHGHGQAQLLGNQPSWAVRALRVPMRRLWGSWP